MTSKPEASTFVRSQILSAEVLSWTNFDKERDLSNQKWFDYRFLTPLEATELYVKSYTKIFQFKYAQNFNSLQAPSKSGVRSRDWKSSSRERVSFWHARQFADELSAPYDLFNETAMQLLLRYGYSRVPRPNHLYGSKWKEAICDRVRIAMMEHMDSRLMVSDLPQYYNANYCGHAAQIAHHESILIQIRRRGTRRDDIARLCWSDCLLPSDVAEREFGTEKLLEAREYFENSLAPQVDRETATEGIRIWPACFGLPAASAENNPACLDCSCSTNCDKIARSIEQLVFRKRGSVDPVNERRKRMQRERTRKCRARKSTPSMPASSSVAP